MGNSSFLNKFYRESQYVNSVKVVGLCSDDLSKLADLSQMIQFTTDNYSDLLEQVDAVYIHSHPQQHFEQCKIALEAGKNVLCESPIAGSDSECKVLFDIAKKNNSVLMEGIRTAYLTAYSRLLLLLKSGKIGEIISVDATCTSLSIIDNFGSNSRKWGAMETWGPTALLPVLQILGTNYQSTDSFSIPDEQSGENDGFTKMNIHYDYATATIKVGMNVKSESDLIISGTKGYAYVPAPWWKTTYFELRYENPNDNKRYFYQVDGEGIRYELVQFASAIRGTRPDFYIDRSVTEAISKIIGESKHAK